MADNHSPLDVLRKRIRDRMNDLADHVSGGGCMIASDASLTAMEYAGVIGNIKGLAEAERELLDLAKEMEVDEDEEGP